MAGDDYLFDEGDGIQIGSPGEHDLIFVDGDSVSDRGLSDLAFEEGTGIGGASFQIDDVQTGAFESGLSHTEFYNYENGSDPNAQGLVDQGINDISDDAMYVFIHYDADAGTYAAGFWHYFAGGNSNDRKNAEVVWQNSDGNAATSAVVRDDPPSVGDADEFTTASDGDIITRNEWFETTGDGGMFELFSGDYEITLEMSEYDAGEGSSGPANYRIRGPLDNATRSGGWGSSITFDVTIP